MPEAAFNIEADGQALFLPFCWLAGGFRFGQQVGDGPAAVLAVNDLQRVVCRRPDGKLSFLVADGFGADSQRQRSQYPVAGFFQVFLDIGGVPGCQLPVDALDGVQTVVGAAGQYRVEFRQGQGKGIDLAFALPVTDCGSFDHCGMPLRSDYAVWGGVAVLDCRYSQSAVGVRPLCGARGNPMPGCLSGRLRLLSQRWSASVSGG